MDLKTQGFIDHTTKLTTDLDKFKKTLFKQFPNYADSIFELNNALDYVKVQYDPTNDSSTNQEIIAKFADRYFKAIVKLLSIVKSINNGNDTTLIDDLNDQFHDIAIDIVAIIGEYGDLLKYYSDDIKNTLDAATHQFKDAKDDVKSQDSSYLNLFRESFLNEEELVSNDPQPPLSRSELYAQALETYNSLPSDQRSEFISKIEMPSVRTALQINRATDGMGQLLNTGMDSLGDMFGHMFIKIGSGAEHASYCIDVINKNGFDAFLNDPQCMDYVKDGVIYGTIFLGIVMVVRAILRRITGFLAWISGYRHRR